MALPVVASAGGSGGDSDRAPEPGPGPGPGEGGGDSGGGSDSPWFAYPERDVLETGEAGSLSSGSSFEIIEADEEEEEDGEGDWEPPPGEEAYVKPPRPSVLDAFADPEAEAHLREVLDAFMADCFGDSPALTPEEAARAAEPYEPTLADKRRDPFAPVYYRTPEDERRAVAKEFSDTFVLFRCVGVGLAGRVPGVGEGRDEDFWTPARAGGPDPAWAGLAVASTPGPTRDEEAEATRAAGPDGPVEAMHVRGVRVRVYTPDPALAMHVEAAIRSGAGTVATDLLHVDLPVGIEEWLATDGVPQEMISICFGDDIPEGGYKDEIPLDSPECEYEFPETFAAWERQYHDGGDGDGGREDPAPGPSRPHGAATASPSSVPAASSSGMAALGRGFLTKDRKPARGRGTGRAAPVPRPAARGASTAASSLELGIQGLGLNGRPTPKPS